MKIIPIYRRGLAHALSLLAPPSCPACRRPAGRRPWALLCPSCRPKFSSAPVCMRCGRRLPDMPALRLHPPAECRACRRLRPHFDAARVVAPYRGAWRQAVLAFKSRPEGELCEQMSGLLRRLLLSGRLPGCWHGVVPVPARRGSDRHPATLLARNLARRLGWPCWPVLRFRRPTEPQRRLRRRERLRNLRHALRAQDANVRGKSLLVLDDVLTTGATASECARALKAAGAVHVSVLALASGSLFENRIILSNPPESPLQKGEESRALPLW